MSSRFRLRHLLGADYSATFFALLLAGFYIFAPLAIYILVIDDPLYLKTAGLASLTLVGVFFGVRLPAVSWSFSPKNKVIAISEKMFLRSIFIIFLLFIGITLVTADSVPLLSAFYGLASTDLSQERGAFLKGREGGWILLLYLSSILSSSIIPYAILLSYFTKSAIRKIFSIVFFIYSIIFLVKALFLNLLLPLVSYGIELNPKKAGKILLLLVGAVGLLLFMIWLSGYGALETNIPSSNIDYFTAAYIPTGVIDYFIYRSFSIPVFSVIDTLHVHSTLFHGHFFLGSTSSLIAGVTGREKINIERHVSDYQYGGWSDFANSNVAFFVDGYVNFGWIGVFVFGIVVGRIFRIFKNSNDVAFRSLSILFSYQLLSSPLIQMLTSNGWILIFLFMSYFKVKNSEIK